MPISLFVLNTTSCFALIPRSCTRHFNMSTVYFGPRLQLHLWAVLFPIEISLNFMFFYVVLVGKSRERWEKGNGGRKGEEIK